MLRSIARSDRGRSGLRLALAFALLLLPAFDTPSGDAVVENSEISGNTSSGAGGGIYLDGSSAGVVNCTVADNESAQSGGGMAFGNGARPLLLNNIVWGNRALSFNDLFNLFGNIESSDIQQPGFSGKFDNISSNPLFKGASDFQLESSSPAVGTGKTSGATVFDRRGALRGGAVDMGAYEYGVSVRTVYVNDTTGSDTNSGLAANVAKKTIQAALDVSLPGDAVSVAAGTYKGSGNKELDFKGKDVSLTGASGADQTVIDCEGSGRAFHFHSGETSSALVKGFSIQNGLVEGEFPYGCGGAMFVIDSSPTLMNLVMKSNEANWGGAIELNNSGSALVNVRISGNTAEEEGGGVYVIGASNVTIVNATIAGNTENGLGGSSRPSVSNSLLSVSIGNSVIERIHVLDATPGQVAVSYSCVEGGFAGNGNVAWTEEGTPMFASTESCKLHPLSPAIDSGDASLPLCPSLDLNGNSRYDSPYAVNGAAAGTPPIDMGAYEFNPSTDNAASTSRTLTLSTGQASAISYTVTDALRSSLAASGSVSSASSHSHSLPEGVYSIAYSISSVNYHKTVLLLADAEVFLGTDAVEIELGDVSSYKRGPITMNYLPFNESETAYVYENEYATVYEDHVTLSKSGSSRSVNVKEYSGTSISHVTFGPQSYYYQNGSDPVLINFPIASVLNPATPLVFDFHFNTTAAAVAVESSGSAATPLDTFMRYHVQVTHSTPSGNFSDTPFYVYEGDSVAFSLGEAAISSTRGDSTVDLAPYSEYTLSGFSPSSLTAGPGVSSSINRISVTATYTSSGSGGSGGTGGSGGDPILAEAAAAVPLTTDCDSGYGGADPSLSGAELNGASALDTRKRYRLQVIYSNGYATSSCYVREGDAAAFSQSQVSITGSSSQSLSLQTFSSMHFVGFTPEGPISISDSYASSSNVISVLNRYANIQAEGAVAVPLTSGCSSGYGGADPSLSGAELNGASALDTRRRYAINVSYKTGTVTTAQTDSIYMVEGDTVSFARGLATITGSGSPGTETLTDFAEMAFIGFAPAGPVTADSSSIPTQNALSVLASYAYNADSYVALPADSLCSSGCGGAAPSLEIAGQTLVGSGTDLDTRKRFYIDIAYRNASGVQGHDVPIYAMEGDEIALIPSQATVSDPESNRTSATTLTPFSKWTINNYTLGGDTSSSAQLEFSLASNSGNAANVVTVYANFTAETESAYVVPDTSSSSSTDGSCGYQLNTWKRFVYDMQLDSERTANGYDVRISWEKLTDITVASGQNIEHFIVRTSTPGSFGTVAFPERVGKGQVLSGNAYVVHVGNIISDDVGQQCVHDSLPAASGTYKYRIYSRISNASDMATVALFMQDEASFVVPIDTDGDGLFDSEESVYGTSPNNADTDGDGLKDGFEVRYGFNPTSSNSASADTDGDGLTNLEEQSYGTDPTKADTDGDGISDYVELRSAFTDPTVADFNGAPTCIQFINGSAYSSATPEGGWVRLGGVVHANARSGSLSYSLDVPSKGYYVLEVNGTQSLQTSTISSFLLELDVDGTYAGRLTLNAAYGSNGSICFFLPELEEGLRQTKITWRNVDSDTALQINSLRLLLPVGADKDGNGIADWIDNRLNRLSEVSVPTASKTSPLCVEGGNALYIGDISIAGFYETELYPAPAATHAPNNRWFANVPLNPSSPTSLTFSFHGGKEVEKSVTWEATNLFLSSSPITIRKGDSLLLTAFPEGATSGSASISVDGATLTPTISEPSPHKFSTAGTFTASATYTPGSGQPQTCSVSIKVVEFSFNGDHTLYNYEFSNSISADWGGVTVAPEAVIETEDFVSASLLGTNIYLSSSVFGASYFIARLGEDGPILDNSTATLVKWYTHKSEGSYVFIEETPTYTVYEGCISLSEVPPDISITLSIFASGITFENGSTSMTIGASDFVDGVFTYKLLKYNNGHTATCHHIIINGQAINNYN